MNACTRLAWLALSTSTALVSPSLLQAAQETEMPSFLHGEVAAGIETTIQRSRFYQHGIDTGRMTERETSPRFDIRFGVLPGLELFATVPTVTSGSRAYEKVSAMCGDDEYGEGASGTATGCTSGDVVSVYDGAYVPNGYVDGLPTWTYGGIGNTAVGLRWAPFHENELGSISSGRSQTSRTFAPLITWRLELAALLNTGSSFYEGGAASGATGIRLGTAFSRKVGSIEPYMSLTYDQYFDYYLDRLTTGTMPDGTELGDQTIEAILTVPSRTELYFGIELAPYTGKDGTRFSVDFAGGMRYLSEHTAISGTRLPVVIPVSTTADGATIGTRYEPILEEEVMAFLGRLRLQYQMMEYVRLDAAASLGYALPHRLELPYSIEQGAHLLAHLRVGLSAHF